MSSIEYIYPFSKDQFIESIQNMQNRFIEDYIIKIIDKDHFMIGVQRAGHSGGYWYKAELNELESKTHIKGELLLLEGNNPTYRYTWFDKIRDFILISMIFILFWWIFILFWIIKQFEKWIQKLKGKPVIKDKTPIEKLDMLMIYRFQCERINR